MVSGFAERESPQQRFERERRREERHAARWAARSGIGSMPGLRFENGESKGRERSMFFAGRYNGQRTCICGHRFGEHFEGSGNVLALACTICSDCTSATWDVEQSNSQAVGTRLRHVSYSGYETMDDWEQHLLKEGRNYLPLVGRPANLGPRELATRAKVQHTLTFMLPMHVELLLMRHVEQLTWEEMAAELCITYQAVQQRLRVAEDDFHRLFAEHADDELDWKEAL